MTLVAATTILGMGRSYTSITEPLHAFIDQQAMFFVGTAPLGTDTHVNVSPKGMDSLRVIDSSTIAYLDLVGSGAETIAHLRENGRITIMWCSFGPTPRILRAYGTGEYLVLGATGYTELIDRFPEYRAVRSIIKITIEQLADSCGFGVPQLDLVGQRTRLTDWADRKTVEELETYMRDKNSFSIDGLRALDG